MYHSSAPFAVTHALIIYAASTCVMGLNSSQESSHCQGMVPWKSPEHTVQLISLSRINSYLVSCVCHCKFLFTQSVWHSCDCLLVSTVSKFNGVVKVTQHDTCINQQHPNISLLNLILYQLALMYQMWSVFISLCMWTLSTSQVFWNICAHANVPTCITPQTCIPELNDVWLIYTDCKGDA